MTPLLLQCFLWAAAYIAAGIAVWSWFDRDLTLWTWFLKEPSLIQPLLLVSWPAILVGFWWGKRRGRQ